MFGGQQSLLGTVLTREGSASHVPITIEQQSISLGRAAYPLLSRAASTLLR